VKLDQTGSEGGLQRAAIDRLRARNPVFGIVQTIPVPTVTELAVWCGADFIILDCEHGVIDEPAHVSCLQAIGTTAFACVRVRPGDFNAVGRYLDFGADAILMPDVRGATDAAAFVAAAIPGPRGTRGSTGSARATRYGLDRSVPQPLLLALVESGEAVANIRAIAATPGLDGVVIGPSDLSADLDCDNDFSAPRYCAAFEMVERSASAAGLLLGTRPHGAFAAERLMSSGHCFIIATSDIGALRAGIFKEFTAARDTKVACHAAAPPGPAEFAFTHVM
jgi:2-keto-3-deoxy-L-rhamnonate aldolase RhmA